MKINDPLVSVLICSHNAEEFVEATVQSVMNQTYSNMEILVLDNNSSDKTVDVLQRLAGEDPRLRIYKGDENLGAYGGLNYLLERAVGKYIAINDHDDVWHTEKITRQVEFLESNSGYLGCGTAMINYYEKYDTFLLRRHPMVATVAWHTSLVFVNTDKRYDASIKLATDFHFMKHILCGNKRRIYNFEEPLLLRKIRGNEANLSSKWIRFENLKYIFEAKISIKDAMPIIGRLVLSRALFDHLVLRFFLKRNVLSRAAMRNDPMLKGYLDN